MFLHDQSLSHNVTLCHAMLNCATHSMKTRRGKLRHSPPEEFFFFFWGGGGGVGVAISVHDGYIDRFTGFKFLCITGLKLRSIERQKKIEKKGSMFQLVTNNVFVFVKLTKSS